MEDQELLEELQAIRRVVRPTWLMVLLLVAVVAVPTVILGCMTAGAIAMEIPPH